MFYQLLFKFPCLYCATFLVLKADKIIKCQITSDQKLLYVVP